MMFALVALMCLYMGGNNIKKAFMLAPFSSWQAINWMLLGTGVAMLLLVVPLVKRGIADYNRAKEDAYERLRLEEEAKKRKYTMDDEADYDLPEE